MKFFDSIVFLAVCLCAIIVLAGAVSYTQSNGIEYAISGYAVFLLLLAAAIKLFKNIGEY